MATSLRQRHRRELDRSMTRASTPAEQSDRIAFDRFMLRESAGIRDWHTWAYFASDLGRALAEERRRDRSAQQVAA